MDKALHLLSSGSRHTSLCLTLVSLSVKCSLQFMYQVLNTLHPSYLFSQQPERSRPVVLYIPCKEHFCALLHIDIRLPGGQPPLQLHQGKANKKSLQI
ncbi:unnamed protein product [Timema podura]|uniref:Uncharacterized protein n=1 Tax=Timema podura TaxID=61482 RepID=A0ABN7PI91_TIMPD|nr:unnamed protein product [Timema podura]